VRENELDLWTCLHFSVLPTDERYRQLSHEQKMLLFTAFLELPSDEQIKNSQANEARSPQIHEEEERNLKALGYSSEAVDRIREQLRLAGMG